MSKYQTLIDALEAPGLSDCPWVAFGPSNDAAPPDYYNEVVAVRGDAQVQVICHAPRGLDGACTADTTYIAEANPSTIRALLADLERAEKALTQAGEFIDDLRQDLHSRRVADWYPEGAHNAASAMSEDMLLLGNRCADFDAIGATEPAKLPLLARSLSEWHEEDGTVVWWAWNGEERGWAGEAAYIGSPLCDDWPGYHTHWTPHPKQPAIDDALAQMAGG